MLTPVKVQTIQLSYLTAADDGNNMSTVSRGITVRWKSGTFPVLLKPCSCQKTARRIQSTGGQHIERCCLKSFRQSCTLEGPRPVWNTLTLLFKETRPVKYNPPDIKNSSFILVESLNKLFESGLQSN